MNVADIEPGMIVATIPSIAAGTRTRIVGTVLEVDRFEIAGRSFASVKLDTDLGVTTHTAMSGEYELISI